MISPYRVAVDGIGGTTFEIATMGYGTVVVEIIVAPDYSRPQAPLSGGGGGGGSTGGRERRAVVTIRVTHNNEVYESSYNQPLFLAKVTGKFLYNVTQAISVVASVTKSKVQVKGVYRDKL